MPVAGLDQQASLTPGTPLGGGGHRRRSGGAPGPSTLVVALATLVGLVAVASVAVQGLVGLGGDDPARVVVARSRGASVAFPDPEVHERGGVRTTTGQIVVRTSSGRPLSGSGRMVVDERHPSRNRLTISPAGDWSEPFGRRGVRLRDPEVAARWVDGAFEVAITGTPDPDTSVLGNAIDITAIEGPDGATAALPELAAHEAWPTATFSSGRALLTLPATSLGTVQLGALTVDDVTLGGEVSAWGEITTVIGLRGAHGSLGPVQILQADGEARVSPFTRSGRLRLSGRASVQDVEVPFALTAPLALRDSTVVIGPDAQLDVPVGTGMRIGGEAQIDLAASADRPLAIANATVSYGELEVRAEVTLGAADGELDVRAALARPLALGSGLHLHQAALSWDGERLGVSGTGRFTDAGAAIDAGLALAGTIDLSGGAPTLALQADGEGRLPFAGAEVELLGGLRVAGPVGGPLEVEGHLQVAHDELGIRGGLALRQGIVELTAAIDDSQSTGRAQLAIDTATGATTASVEVDRVTVQGVEVTDVLITGSAGPHQEARAELERGTVRLPDGRTIAVRGSLRTDDGAVALQVVGTTDVLGATARAEGMLRLADGRATIDVAVAAGTLLELGGSQVGLSGEVRVAGDPFGVLSVTATAEVAGNRLQVAGTLQLTDGALLFELATPEGVEPSGSLRLRFRPDTAQLTGRAELVELRIGAGIVAEAALEIELSPEQASIEVTGAADLGPDLHVSLAGSLATDGGPTTLRAEGDLVFQGVDVPVTGSVRFETDGTQLDLRAAVDRVRVPLGGTDLVLGGAVRLRGPVGGPFAVEASATVYATAFEVAGTLRFDAEGWRLDLDHQDRLHLEVVGRGGALTAVVESDHLVIGDLDLADARLSLASVDGELRGDVRGELTWGATRVAVAGSVSRSSEGALAVQLAVDGAWPLAPGVTVHHAELTHDGTTTTLSADGEVLLSGAEAALSLTGSVAFGDRPSVDVRTDAEGRVPVGDGQALAFVGELHLRVHHGGVLQVSGAVELLHEVRRVQGTFSLDDGRIQVAVESTEPDGPTLGLELAVDPAADVATGRIRTADLRIDDLHVRQAELGIRYEGGRLALRLAGTTAFGPALEVAFDGSVEVDGSDVVLQVDGSATIAGHYVDVGVEGAVAIDPDGVRYDLRAEAGTTFAFDPHGDIELAGAVRLHGAVGGPTQIEGQLSALGNQVQVHGTVAAGDGGVELDLAADGPDGLGGAARLTVGRAGAVGHIELTEARLDALHVTELVLDAVVSSEGDLEVQVGGAAQLADPSGRVAGILSADARLVGTYRRTAEGRDDLSLRATIDRMRTDGTGAGGIVEGLGLDYLDVTVDLTRAAAGSPTTIAAGARLAATRGGDGSLALVNGSTVAGNASIELAGTLELSAEGTISAWQLRGAVDRLRYQDLVASATLHASGAGLDGGARLDVAAEVAATDGRLAGRLEGVIGYQGGALDVRLSGTLRVRNLSGVDADLQARTTSDRTLVVEGPLSFGPLIGEVDGRLGLVTREDGSLWPVLDVGIDSWHHATNAAELVSTDIAKITADTRTTVFAGARLSSWDHPDSFSFTASALGAAASEVALGLTVPSVGPIPKTPLPEVPLGPASADASVHAEGTLQMRGGSPSYRLTVRATGDGGANVLGFLWLGGHGNARIEVDGDFHRAAARAYGLANLQAGAGPVALAGADAAIDLGFDADLDAQKVQVWGTAHAGASILGPVVTARGDLRLSGTVDLQAKRADLHAEGGGSANVLWILGRGDARGWADFHVDFATPGAPPVVTGNARIDASASAVLWELYGFHANLRYDGEVLWVTDGWRLLGGDGVIEAKRWVQNLRGVMTPQEQLCGDQYVEERVWEAGWRWFWSGAWLWGGDWTYQTRWEGRWGDCNGQSTATGRVLADTDGSGGASPGDAGIAGVEVEIRNGAGARVGGARTTANGVWRVTGLTPGDGYRVVVRAPEGWPIVQDGAGAADGVLPLWVGLGAVSEVAPVVLGVPPAPTTLEPAPDATGNGTPSDGSAPVTTAVPPPSGATPSGSTDPSEGTTATEPSGGTGPVPPEPATPTSAPSPTDPEAAVAAVLAQMVPR